jgi:hypothetical protein
MIDILVEKQVITRLELVREVEKVRARWHDR